MVHAKGFFVALLLLTFTLASCSKQKDSQLSNSAVPQVEVFPISTGELKNCRFQNQNPVYSFGAAIPPNPVVCDSGVATSVQLLSPSPLPTGLSFAMNQLSLAGTANEKVSKAPYQFYIENSSGYQILKIQITVQ